MIYRPTKAHYFMMMARLVSTRSTCARRAVGCVLVDNNYFVVSTGYNGVPPGERHCIEFPCDGALDKSGDLHRCKAIHAEKNAVEQARSRGLLDAVTRAYVTTTPCHECAGLMYVLLPNLREVNAGSTYTQDSRQFFQDRRIVTHVDENVMQCSMDALLKQGERSR